MIEIPEDRLARAEAALRETPVPDSPPAELLRQTLAALAVPNQPNHSLVRRRTNMIRLGLSIAAAVVLTIGGGLLYLSTQSQVAFADVARNLRDAKSFAFQLAVQSKTGEERATMQFFWKEPGLVRLELPHPGGLVIVRSDKDKVKGLYLNSVLKTALLIDKKVPGTEEKTPKKGPVDDPLKWVEKLRSLVEKEARPVGKKKIGKVQAHGFQVELDQEEFLVWADPETRLPLRVELGMPDGTRCILSEFRFNPNLDDALFSLEVPKGYELTPVELDELKPEESLVRVLRAYAEAAGGKFPKQLNNPDTHKVPLEAMWEAQDKNKKEGLSPRQTRLITTWVEAVAFVKSLKEGHGYKPDGAKLGDADTIIFWYRPEGATKSRALYGDLHWADVTTDKLPETPKP